MTEEEKEFIQNFGIELTNTTLDEREEIGKNIIDYFNKKNSKTSQQKKYAHIVTLLLSCHRIKAFMSAPNAES